MNQKSAVALRPVPGLFLRPSPGFESHASSALAPSFTVTLCLRGSFKETLDLASLRATDYTFSLFAGLCEMRTPRRVVPSASTSVNYSPLSAAQASSRSSSAPRSFYSTYLSGTRAQSCITVLNDCLNALNACANKRRTRKAQLDSSYMECIDTRGVRVCVSTLHNVGNIPRTTICKSSSGMSIATLAPASIRYTDAFTPTLCTTGGLPRFPNVPTLAVQASSSSRNMPPRSLCSSPTLTYSFRHYCVTPTTDPPSLQERQLSTRPHTLVAILNGQRLAELVALL